MHAMNIVSDSINNHVQSSKTNADLTYTENPQLLIVPESLPVYHVILSNFVINKIPMKLYHHI